MPPRKAVLNEIEQELGRIAESLGLLVASVEYARVRVAALYRDWTQETEGTQRKPSPFLGIDRTSRHHQLALFQNDPISRNTVEMIRAWRRREKRLDLEPLWGSWCEFTVPLSDGSRGIVVYMPGGDTGFPDKFEVTAPFTHEGSIVDLERDSRVKAEASGVTLRAFTERFVLQFEETVAAFLERGTSSPLGVIRAVGQGGEP